MGINEENKNIIRRIKLTPRLEKLAELVPRCEALADIGTDHAYIPAALVSEGIAAKAIASDIVAGPVERARETVARYALSDKIDVRMGAGLETVVENEADVIVVAGMGGILISEILEKSRRVTDGAKMLILQPMTAVRELREYLCGGGYTITGEYLVKEESKLYNIITAHSGGDTEYTVKEMYLGRDTRENSPSLFDEYKKRILIGLKRRAEGLERSARGDKCEEIRKIDELIELLSE